MTAAEKIKALPLPEPAAWEAYWRGDNDSISWSQWHDASDPLPQIWEGDPPDEVTPHYTADQMRALLSEAAAIASAHDALMAQPEGWKPIETAPKDGRKVMLFYMNRANKPRRVLARWLTDEQAAETDADDVGLEGGWYECIDNWDDYTQVALHEGDPSHWMPLPAAPDAASPQPAVEAAQQASESGGEG